MNLTCTNILLIVLFIFSNVCDACKNPDFDALQKMRNKELAQYGCTKDHVRIQVFSRSGKLEEVIKVAEKLKRHKLIDAPSLREQAFVLYKLGLYKDALTSHLASKTAPTSCDVFLGCRMDYSSALDHYETSFYYQANGDIHEAENEFRAGESEFFSICLKHFREKNYCVGVLGRMLMPLNEAFKQNNQ